MIWLLWFKAQKNTKSLIYDNSKHITFSLIWIKRTIKSDYNINIDKIYYLNLHKQDLNGY